MKKNETEELVLAFFKGKLIYGLDGSGLRWSNIDLKECTLVRLMSVVGLILSFGLGGHSSEPLAIQKKIESFNEFEAQKEKDQKLREDALSEFLQSKKDKKKEETAIYERHLAEKAKIKKIKPEDTPGFQEFIEKKIENIDHQESEREKVVEELKNKKPSRTEKLFEVREYGLQDTEKNRVPTKLRISKKSGRPSSNGANYPGGADDYRDNSYDSSPSPSSPPIEDVPEFDNDIPPPPPPPPMPGDTSFDEIPPPPMESGEPVPPPNY